MMLAVFSLASCSSYDIEKDKPFTVCPEEQIKFFACETSGETRGASATIDTLFTEDVSSGSILVPAKSASRSRTNSFSIS